jgi:parallel beta-helix repeat protein
MVALILLTLLIPVFTTTCSSSSGWRITVQTDKPHYYHGDTVYIGGTLTYNDWPQQGVQVTINVRLSSSSTPYYQGTAKTDSDGKYNVNFTLGINATPGEYVVLANYQGHTSQVTFQVLHAIYIRGTGEVEPAYAPISRDGDMYTLTDNIAINSTDAIVIEKSDIVLNGAGFTVRGISLANSNGINLNSVSNVTLTNISTRLFAYGVGEYSCSNCNILDGNLSSNGYGIYFQGSNFNTIEGNNITQNSYAGIFLYSSQNNTIDKNRLANTVSSNLVGAIRLEYSSYNGVTDNNFINNTKYGIYIGSYCYSNQIFHNSLINNTHQVYLDTTSSLNGNVWDNGYPSGGNYWNDYTGVDVKSGPDQDQPGSDGIGDTPYIINADNKDMYPFMNAWNPTETTVSINGTEHPVTITTNATITHIDSTLNSLNFTATGASGNKGYMLIIVPKGLNSTRLTVLINNTELTAPPPQIDENETHYFIYCQLSFSTLQIRVPFAVPGPTPLETLATAISTILILGVYTRVRKKKTTTYAV